MAQLWSVAKRRWRSRKCTDCVDGTTLVLHRTVALPPPHNCCRSCGTRRPRGQASSRNGTDLCDRRAEVVGYTSCAWPLRRSSRRLRIFAVDAYLRPNLLTRHVSSTWYFDRSLMQARYGTVLQMHRLWNRWVTRRRLHAHAPEVAPARS